MGFSPESYTFMTMGRLKPIFHQITSFSTASAKPQFIRHYEPTIVGVVTWQSRNWYYLIAIK
jgi:hypothetical protein